MLVVVVFVVLAVEGASAVFGHVDHETIHFGEGLIASVTVVVVFAFQFAEGSAAAQFGTVEGVR